MGGRFVLSICTNQEKGQSMQVGTKIVHIQPHANQTHEPCWNPNLEKKIPPPLYFLIVYFVNNNKGCITMAKGVAQFLKKNLENS
jgi:hypothetical protein